MIVKTESGSIYAFCEKDGNLYLLKGAKEYLVTKMTLGIGISLEVSGRELNSMTYEVGENEVTFTSTPVVDITFQTT